MITLIILTMLAMFAGWKNNLLFLGEERQGLTQQERNLCDHLVRIPMVGTADSLNLGVAGSLLMYEVYRSENSKYNQSDGME